MNTSQVSVPLYVTEDVDFYADLKKAFDDAENNTTSDDCNSHNEPCCRITGEPLTDSAITLTCSHSFNYKPLYNEIYNQVNRFKTFYSYNLSEYERMIIQNSQHYRFFKCPYCRIIQFSDFPIRDDENVTEIYNKKVKICNPSKCIAILKKGKNKGMECGYATHPYIYTAPSDLRMSHIELHYCRRHLNTKNI